MDEPLRGLQNDYLKGGRGRYRGPVLVKDRPLLPVHELVPDADVVIVGGVLSVFAAGVGGEEHKGVGITADGRVGAVGVVAAAVVGGTVHE